MFSRRSRSANTSSGRRSLSEGAGAVLPATRYRFVTPRGELSMVLQANEHTAWLTERPIKENRDIDLLARFMPAPKCDVPAVNAAVARHLALWNQLHLGEPPPPSIEAGKDDSQSPALASADGHDALRQTRQPSLQLAGQRAGSLRRDHKGCRIVLAVKHGSQQCDHLGLPAIVWGMHDVDSAKAVAARRFAPPQRNRRFDQFPRYATRTHRLQPEG